MERKRTCSQKGPPIIESKDKEIDATPEAAELMLVVPETAPRTAGVDDVLTVIVCGSDKGLIAEKIEQISEERNVKSFKHCATNMKDTTVVVMIDARWGKSTGLNYEVCGYATSAESDSAEETTLACTLMIRPAFSRHLTSEQLLAQR